MAVDVGDQLWEFDVCNIMRMLSPKSLRPECDQTEPYPALDSFRCLVDDRAVRTAMDAMPMPTKIQFATIERPRSDRASDLGTSILRPRKERWWPSLLFPVCDPRDSAYGTVQPALVARAAAADAPGEPISSPPQAARHTMLITLAALAKGGWGGIVTLAERYARMQFDAAPLRLFSLVIGVNCKTHTLRFLIFHRGGLTASREIELDEQEGRCAAQQVLSSILLWQKAKDAVPSFTNGVEWVIPSDDPARPIHVDADEVLFLSSSVRGRGTVVLRVLPREEECDLVHIRHLLSRGLQQMRCRPQTEPLQTNRATTTATWSCTEPAQYYHDAPLYLRLPNMIGPARTVLCSQNPRGVVLKSSWPDRKKLRIEAEVYASCNGQFGVPDHLLSFEACHSDGAAFSNSIFLPPIGCTTFASYRWYPFDEHDSAASPPDYRTLQVIVIADEGESLEHCESAKDLSMCVLHAQLGWLFMMSIAGKGYLHRDASIGNVVRPNVPVQRRAFTSRRGVEELVKGLHHIKHSASSEAIESNNEGAQGSHDRSGAEGAKRHSDKEGFWTNLGGAAGHNPYLKNVVNAAQRLEKALAKLGLSTECRALLIDGECAGFLPEYFVDPPHAGNVFGTPAFMSETLIIQSQKMANSIYVHNPVDDLNSFMWTTIWGTVFNPRADASQRSAAAQETLKQWQKMLRTHERLSALHEIEGSVPDDSSPIVEGIPSLIRIWRRELEDLEITFRRTFKKAPNAEQKFDVFCRFAREGVAVYAELLHELRDTLGLDATQ